MNLQKLLQLASSTPKDLSAEDAQLHYELKRKTNEPLIRSQLLPRLRAPYQLNSIIQSSFSPGRLTLSWNDINLTRTGIGQKLVVTVPKGAVSPTKNVGLVIDFNDQVPERPELGQITGRVRQPEAMRKGRNSTPEIQRAYNNSAQTQAAPGIQVAKGKVLNFEETPDGQIQLEIEVTERNLEKLNWHFQRNYGTQAAAIIEMAPSIVESLLKEASAFVRNNSDLLLKPEQIQAYRDGTISENEFISRGLQTYAVTCYAMPERLMTNMGRNHNPVVFTDSDEVLAQRFSEGILGLSNQYKIPGIDEKAGAMIHGINNADDARENEVEAVEARIQKIRESADLKEIVGEKGSALAEKIFLNHLYDDTGFGKADPIMLSLPTLGLPGDIEGEEADREKIQEQVYSHNEEMERKGEEPEGDSNQAQIEHLLGSEKSRSRAIPLPTSAHALNALREYPGNPQNHMIRRIMTETLAAAEKGAPPQARDLTKKLRDLLRPGTPSDKLVDLERSCVTLGKRLAANWYSGNPADILLRILVKNGVQGKDAEFVKQKGGHNVASAFLNYTSRHTQNQNPLHPAPNRLVAHALFGITPQGNIPREALADFAARLSHARHFEPVIFKPTEVLLPDEAADVTNKLNSAFQQDPSSKEVEQARKAVANLTVGILSGLSTNEDQSWVSQISRRSGINLPTNYRVRGEENLTSRAYLAQLANETIPAQPGNISETSKKLDTVFAPYLQATQLPEEKPVVVLMKLDHLQDTDSRIPGAEAFGELANLNQNSTRAVTTDSMLPAVWAKKNDIPYTIKVDQVNLTALTESESAEINNLINKAFKATEKELAADTPRGLDLRNQELVLDMQKAVSDAKGILKNLEAPREKPQIVLEAITRIRGNEFTEGFLPSLEAEMQKEIPGSKHLEAFNAFKTELPTAIQHERDDLDNSLPALTRIFEETRQIGAFLKDYNPGKRPSELEILSDGSLGATRIWLQETIDGKAIDMTVMETMTQDLLSNPPRSHAQLVDTIVDRLVSDLVVSAPSEPKPGTTRIGSFRPEDGVIESSLVKAYSRAYGHNGAVRSYGMTAAEPVRKNQRYDAQKNPGQPQQKGMGLI
jgi:hypothetical protein